MIPKRPHDNTYWVEPGRLLAGEYPGASNGDAASAKLRQYLDAGVDYFVDLTEDGELEPYEARLHEADRRTISDTYGAIVMTDNQYVSGTNSLKCFPRIVV
jgi:hypothetical protein